MARDDKRIQAVIFDLDDTLIDWSEADLSWDSFSRPMVDNVHAFLQENGHELPEAEEFHERMRHNVQAEWEEAKEDFSGASFGNAIQRTLREYDIEADAALIETLMRVYDWRPMPGVDLFDDALDVLDSLRACGYKIGLITNSFLPMWMRDVELRHYNLIDYFDARITSGDTGFMKPHTAIYERMLGLLEINAANAVFVGDRPANDIRGANEAGMISVLIDPPHLDRELEGVQPDYTITTLTELLAVLEELD